MNPIRWVFVVPLSAAAVLTSSPLTAPCLAQTAPASPVGALPVYLADFELHAVPTQSSRRPVNSSTSRQSDDEPAAQARRLITALSSSFTDAFKRAGYVVQAFPPATGQPNRGILLRGVFTEPDEYNRVRRAIHGSGSKSPKSVLYVGVSNLARPEQPLYQLVPPNSPGYPVDTRFGPLITITSYSPVASFDLSKHPTDDDIKRLGSDLVARFSSLVYANPWLTR